MNIQTKFFQIIFLNICFGTTALTHENGDNISSVINGTSGTCGVRDMEAYYSGMIVRTPCVACDQGNQVTFAEGGDHCCENMSGSGYWVDGEYYEC